jgi:hypothetical protein
MIDDETDLKERFGDLRREAAARTPSFHATLAAVKARRRAAPRHRALWLGGAVAVSAVLVFLLARRGQPGARMAIDLASARWHAPTDFLLALPGEELLRTVPRLGRLTLDRRSL